MAEWAEQERKAVTFCDIPAEDALLEEEFSRPVLLLDLKRGTWETTDRSGSMAEALDASGVVVIRDRAFCTLETPKPFVDFYESGGTVVVLASGVVDIGAKLQVFGVQWRYRKTEDARFRCTQRGRDLLGDVDFNLENAHLLMVPDADAIVEELPATRSDMGLLEDGSDDVDEELSYASYLQEFRPGTLVAIHHHPSHHGNVVYFGASSLSPTSSPASAVFTRLCCHLSSSSSC